MIIDLLEAAEDSAERFQVPFIQFPPMMTFYVTVTKY